MKRLLVFVLLATVLFSLSAIAFNGHFDDMVPKKVTLLCTSESL